MAPAHTASTQAPMARPVLLREVHWRDLDTLAAAERELFAADAWSEQLWWAELAGRPRREYLIADIDGRVVGYAGLDHGGEVADVMTIAVLVGHQGQGIGALLLDELIVRASQRGAGHLMLEVRADNNAARALYRSRGFATISTRPRYYQPEGVDALIMRTELTQEVR